MGAVLLAAAPTAAAAPVADAVATLRVSQLYVSPSLTSVKLDSGLGAALRHDVKIALLPDGAGPANTLATEIGRDLGAGPQRPLTIAVVTVAADRIVMRAASSKYCSGQADAQALAAAGAVRSRAQGSGDLTPVIQDFVQGLSQASVDRGDCAGGAGTSGSSDGNDTSNGATSWVLVGLIALLCALGVGGLGFVRRRRRQRELDLARTRVQPYYDRLANEITTLDPKGDPHAEQALADASERFGSAGSLLASADSVEKYGLAQRSVIEGLHAARTARTALGMDPGPALPAPAPSAALDGSAHEQLSEPQQVSVQGQQFRGYPTYTPGAPYYYGGGYGVPGGWYGVPFWETLLVGSVLGGGMFGYGYDGYGYGPGYEAGYGDGEDSAGNASGGGDFASGGGDLGGGDFASGDGDFANFGGSDVGGGDFGGGDGGGGDFS